MVHHDDDDARCMMHIYIYLYMNKLPGKDRHTYSERMTDPHLLHHEFQKNEKK